MTPRHIAVIDIGKTNAKLALVDLVTVAELAVVTRPNRVISGPPYPHFDIKGHWDFILDALGQFHRTHRIDAISVTTHGASCALLDVEGGLAAPVLDYEYDGPESVASEYDALRPPFSVTGSPRLGMGLNVGAQLHWQFATHPGLKERTRTIVTYPQYWGYRLTGIAATDVTSLGCHTDLWCPREGRFSELVDRLGIRDKLAPAHHSADILGTILPQIASVTGLSPETPVTCGIHDSNASLYPHILTRVAPFSVVSTGTWVIALAVGGEDIALDPTQDTLVNVNALGQPIRSARFMGGREFELISAGQYVSPTGEEIAAVLHRQSMLLPAVVSESGPFRGKAYAWLSVEPAIGTGERSASLSFYLALVTAHSLGLIGAKGDTVVEGVFSKNRPYLGMLATATGRHVVASTSATGTSIGAALLYANGAHARKIAASEHIGPIAAYSAYAEIWQRAVASSPAADLVLKL